MNFGIKTFVVFSLISLLFFGCTQSSVDVNKSKDTTLVKDNTKTEVNVSTNADNLKTTERPKEESRFLTAVDYPCSLVSTTEIDQACGTKNVAFSNLTSNRGSSFIDKTVDTATCFYSRYDPAVASGAAAPFSFNLHYESKLIGRSLEDYAKSYSQTVTKLAGVGDEAVTFDGTNIYYIMFTKNGHYFELKTDSLCPRDKLTNLAKTVADRVQ